MALGPALVDRAALLVKTEAGAAKKGLTHFEEVPGAWFRCRLTVPEAAASVDSERGRWRAPKRPTLMCGVRDLDGGLIVLGFDKRLLVVSVEQGIDSVWRITGEPAPMRKRRTLLGWEVTVERVEEHDRKAVV